jgi:uncharacterized protein YcbK (DUF882 family)
MGLAAFALSMIPETGFTAVKNIRSTDRGLSLFNVYTKENLRITYFKDGKYLPEALARINHMFRDTRTGKVKSINTDLLNFLSGLHRQLKTEKPFHIVSGYRTPRSNAILRKKKKGVARNSFHMYGKAVDIRLPGYRIKNLRHAAIKMRAGGVGYYPRSRFIHLDVGNVRTWWG